MPVLLITRPEPEATNLADAIKAEFKSPFKIVLSPLIQIEPVRHEVDLNGYSAVIFTSSNGVKFGPQPNADRVLRAFCVGDRTAAAAEAKGYASLSANGDSEDLKKLILSEEVRGKLLHLRGVHSRGDFAEVQNSNHPNIESVIVYDQKDCSLSEQAATSLNDRGPVVVPLYSPKTAESLVKQGPWNGEPVFVAMSNAVAEVLSSVPHERLVIASEPNGEAMLKAICLALRGNSGVSCP